ncbi:MAG: hypothetical protein HRO68_07610 [Nitrosopumilus sp.]|nr:hypothetical protein [Nitrosopumilus sp.]
MAQESTRPELSRSDLGEISYYSKGKELSSLAKKSLIILSYMFGGLHNFPSTQKEKFEYSKESCIRGTLFGGMSTFDSDKLTTLVILAHELAVRVDVKPCSFRYLDIFFSERQREGRFYERHPSIEEAVKNLRVRY